MPDAQKMQLNEMMKRLPTSRQEQLIAELVATHQRREAMSAEARQAEDMEMMQLQQAWTGILANLDPL